MLCCLTNSSNNDICCIKNKKKKKLRMIKEYISKFIYNLKEGRLGMKLVTVGREQCDL